MMHISYYIEYTYHIDICQDMYANIARFSRGKMANEVQPAKVRMSKNLVITRKVAKNPVTWPIFQAGDVIFFDLRSL